jgi:hypothetical protein
MGEVVHPARATRAAPKNDTTIDLVRGKHLPERKTMVTPKAPDGQKLNKISNDSNLSEQRG